MITKRNIKLKIELSLDRLHEAETDLQEAMGMIGDTGNRIDLAGVQAGLIDKVEDLIYEPDDIEIKLEDVITSTAEMFRFITDEKSVVFSEANH